MSKIYCYKGITIFPTIEHSSLIKVKLIDMGITKAKHNLVEDSYKRIYNHTYCRRVQLNVEHAASITSQLTKLHNLSISITF